MAKLKVNNVKKVICSTCKGNGYISMQDIEDKTEINIHQCWDCDSEGEFYETIGTSNLISDDNSGNNTLQ
jgi:DnaJ-class molecular chaperone